MILKDEMILLSVLGINITVGYCVNGIMSPEENPAAGEIKCSKNIRVICVYRTTFRCRQKGCLLTSSDCR